jgi:UDP-3-O-[3-hydroxymyristoyl] glucosamine N-acyltransferase
MQRRYLLRLAFTATCAVGAIWLTGMDPAGRAAAQHLTGRPILGEGSIASPDVTLGQDVDVGAGVKIGARVRVGNWTPRRTGAQG